jgi:hypothetical protein
MLGGREGLWEGGAEVQLGFEQCRARGSGAVGAVGRAQRELQRWRWGRGPANGQGKPGGWCEEEDKAQTNCCTHALLASAEVSASCAGGPVLSPCSLAPCNPYVDVSLPPCPLPHGPQGPSTPGSPTPRTTPSAAR